MEIMEMTFPGPPGSLGAVVWNGQRFVLPDGTTRSVLAYQVQPSGWTDELTEMHEREAGEDHYIDVASREEALRRVLKWVGESKTILEVGCSSGFMLKLLRRKLPGATLIGSDYTADTLARLAADVPGIPLLQFDLTTCPLPDASVDGAVLLNVLEHIEDDRMAAQQLLRILRPGGSAIIEVPAGPAIYDVYDKQLMHFRRYRLRDLVKMFEDTGFEVVEKSHLGVFMYPAFWMVKKRNRRYLNAPPDVQQRMVAASIRKTNQIPLMTSVMRMEAKLRGLIPYPFGARCLVVARKRRIT
jgi:SAM-dependent methyltransferase